MFIVTDNEKRLSRAEARIDKKIDKLERLEKAMKEQKDVANRSGNRSEPD
jgi:hypothetical protein